MKKLVYPACLYPIEDTEDSYTVVIPDLPGAITEGNSLEEALEMAIDCASGWILTAIEDGEDIPQPSKVKDVVLDDKRGFITYIILDIDEYSRIHGNKSVKKTVTLPNYLNTLAEKQKINFSQVLQEGLKEKLL